MKEMLLHLHSISKNNNLINCNLKKKFRSMNIRDKLENIPECKYCNAWKTYPNIKFKYPFGIFQKRKWNKYVRS